MLDRETMSYLEQFGTFQYILLCFGVCLCFVAYVFKKKRKFNLPPGPAGLPIVGIMPFLGKTPHLELCNLGKKYGGIFSAYLGRSYVVVVTDVAIAKQLLSKSCTTDRPPDLFQLLPDGAGIGEHNGSEWTEQRRYTMMEMKKLGLGRSHWEELVKMEVSDLLDVLAQSHGKPVDIKNELFSSMSNNLLSLLTDNRLPMGKRGNEIYDGVESFQKLYKQSGLLVYFPKLFKFLIGFGLLSVGKEMKDMGNMNSFIRQEIEETKRRGGHSFIDKYLAEIEKNKRLNLANTFNEKNLIGNAQAVFLAGVDTTYISLRWLFLIMASFPEIQEKVHEELDDVLGKDDSTHWVDRQQLPYCLATIMEGQRWRTVAPLNVLHRLTEDLQINGYDIPKGSNLLTVLWAFHYDTKYWKDPDLFQPERFLSSDGKTIEEQEAYLPFSFGKRGCPAKTVAYIEMFQYFVSIMQKFQVLPESDTVLPDLEGFVGLTLQPKSQPLRFVPR